MKDFLFKYEFTINIGKFQGQVKNKMTSLSVSGGELPYSFVPPLHFMLKIPLGAGERGIGGEVLKMSIP
jgi:hypothetical protein